MIVTYINSNSAEQGGGLYATGSHGTIENTNIVENVAEVGSGIHLDGDFTIHYGIQRNAKREGRSEEERKAATKREK